MIFSKLLHLFRKKKKLSNLKEHQLMAHLEAMMGCAIKNFDFYREAFSLKANNRKQSDANFERLEFLGDAILDAVISYYLFETYPTENEGFLTKMKSKVVNRKNLNELGEKYQLKKHILNYDGSALSENITGNLFEAFVGAMFRDLGYDQCQQVLLRYLLTPAEILKLEKKIISYKGLLIEWSQKNKLNIAYDTQEEQLPNKRVRFQTTITINNKVMAKASEVSKKKTEEKAAQRAYYALQKKQNING
jgi:ribonuclease III